MAPETRADVIDRAITHLRIARDLLRTAKAPKTTKRVRLTLTSAHGARRHAELDAIRTARHRDRT